MAEGNIVCCLACPKAGGVRPRRPKALCEQSGIPTAGTPDRCALDNTRFRTGVPGEVAPDAAWLVFATLEWVDWFNNRRLLEPIGNIPPAEAEERYYAMLEQPAMAA